MTSGHAARSAVAVRAGDPPVALSHRARVKRVEEPLRCAEQRLAGVPPVVATAEGSPRCSKWRACGVSQN